MTTIHDAIKNGDIEQVKILLKNKEIDINEINSDGYIPFNIACYQLYNNIVKILLKDERLDITKLDNDGNTPLHSACLTDDVTIIELLLKDERVDNINTPNNEGRIPFNEALYHGCYDTLEILLKDDRFDISQMDSLITVQCDGYHHHPECYYDKNDLFNIQLKIIKIICEKNRIYKTIYDDIKKEKQSLHKERDELNKLRAKYEEDRKLLDLPWNASIIDIDKERTKNEIEKKRLQGIAQKLESAVKDI